MKWAHVRQSSGVIAKLRTARTAIRRAINHSTAVRGLRAGARRSVVVSRIRHFNRSLGAALDNSTLGYWGRQSAIYTWLTAPVETTEVTIDLRESYTVAPLIQLYEWAKPRAVGSWIRSRARAQLDETAADIDQRPVRAVSIVLAAALVTNTLLLAALGSLQAESLPLRGIVFLLALLGTRV